MRIIVQKFGGTSVATAERRAQVASRVKHALDEGYTPVVVVSAMGRAGDPYATDTFIQMATSIYKETNPRELDMLIGCGELISAVIMTNTLLAQGVPAVAFTGGQAGIVVDNNFGNANILRVNPEHMVQEMKQGKVPVVAGFQGWTEAGEIATLGRGGSDTSAAALGAALRAEVVEIYTDVDGIKTADPRIVPEARTIDVTTYDEIVQMAHQGAKVIHPRAVEIAMRRGVPLRVKSTFDESPGTLVTYSIEATAAFPEVHLDRIITGVTHIPNMARVVVPTPNQEDEADLEVEIFRSLADAGISVDLINVSPEQKSFAIPERLADRAERVLTSLGLKPKIQRACAKVSVVGTGMRGVPGVMANVVEALRGAGVKILQTADSHITISCLVKAEDMEKAVRALHQQFALNR